MSIRLRLVDGVLVALCAARSIEKPGDVYLDDAQHHALIVKFDIDMDTGIQYPAEQELIEKEESNNPNREWWNRQFGKHD